MCLSEQNGLHWGAVKWYYEFVAGYGPDVPEAIIRHIRRCLVCRKQIERLKEAVCGAGGETRGSRSTMKRDVIDTLSLHFGCLEERVTCGRVKPFLPGLLLPSTQLRIPTPITVHIDHCSECAEDLEALRHLGLTAEQLERLERLYQNDSLDTSPHTGPRRGSAWPALVWPWLRPAAALRCRRARTGISAFVQGRLEDLDAETLDHLCTCPRCRPHVGRNRQDLLENQTSDASNPTVCAADVPVARLFDYAIPYGRTAKVAQPSPVEESRVAQPPSAEKCDQSTLAAEVPPDHVETCPACLRRIQELDETLYGIAERADSGVVTVYRTAEDDAPPQSVVPIQNTRASEDHVADMKAGPVAGQPIDLYPDYPIRVQVLRGQPQSAVAVAAWKRTAFDPRVRFLLKTAVAAAAVIPLTFLFLNTSPASGTTLAQVVKAFGQAQSVHVIKSNPNTGQITQELWISRTAGRVLMRRGQEGELQNVEVRHAINACLGFAPRELPPSAKWTLIGDNIAEGSKVYELSYTEPVPVDTVLLRRVEITVDPVARVPREIRLFRKAPAEEDWHYLTRIEYRYLTEDEVASVIRSR